MTRLAAPVRQPTREFVLGTLVAAIGALVLVGWAFDIATLRSVVPGQLGMKANTALGFMLSGLAVAVSAGRPEAARSSVVVLLAIVVALLGALTLTEELFSLDFGIDELLFRDRGGVFRIARKGRMSPAAAFCFLSIGSALLLSAMPERQRLQLPLAAALSASTAIIGALVLASLVSNKGFGLRWGSAVTMAGHTAACFVILGVATFLRARRLQCSNWALGRAGTAGFVVGMVLMLGSAELAASFAQDMEATSTQVVNTQQTLQQLQEIRTELRALESAQRGHLLLADESLLASREADKASVRKRIASLSQAPPGNALPPEHLGQLGEHIEQRLAFGDRLIAVRRTQGLDAALALVATGEDVALTARITGSIAPMLQLQRDRLAANQQHLGAVTATTFLLLPLGSFFGLAALLAGLFFLDHGFGTRTRAEQALRRSQAELRVVFDSMSEGVRVVDPSRNIVHQNPAGAGIHGLVEPALTLDAILRQVEAMAADGQLLPHAEWPGPRALRGDFVRDLELTFRRIGTERMVVAEVTTAPLPAEPGQPARVVITSHDITERKRAQTAIREAQERLERIIENLTEGLLIHGLKGDLVHWNRAALAMYGLTRNEAEAMTLEQFQRYVELSTLDGETVPFGRWPIALLMQGETVQGLELRVRCLDGAWERVFCYGGARVHDAAGKPLVFLTVTDVSARKSAERQLQKLNDELEQRVAQRTGELQAKTRELEGFCYSVSHDLKAPLRGIDGYSRLLMDEYADKLDPDARLFIANVRKAAGQMNALIEDLLAYSRQERRASVPARIGLRAFVGDKVARYAAELAGVEVQVDLEDLRVRADREGLAMAFRNLLDNAIKFSAHSRPPVIAIRGGRVGNRCVLSVQDNGTGFDMRYHDKAFEIFQRLHRAEDYPGTGVGLALVRKAMERMGGRVWADSRPGEGATFHLELELADDTAAGDTTY